MISLLLFWAKVILIYIFLVLQRRRLGSPCRITREPLSHTDDTHRQI